MRALAILLAAFLMASSSAVAQQRAEQSSAERSWKSAVSEHLLQHVRGARAQLAAAFGRLGSERHIGDTTHVRFKVDRAGRVISAGVKKTSGYKALDEVAVRIVSQASPFPPMPAEMRGSSTDFVFPLAFRLSRPVFD